jgi:translin
VSELWRGLKTLRLDDVAALLRRVISEIDSRLSVRERERDEMIKKSRDVTRLSGWVVNAIHRGSLEEARRYLEEMNARVKEFLRHARSDPFLYHSGLVHSTLAEYVEAMLFYHLVVEGRLLTPKELGVDEVPYLQGLGDVVGELRRLALDLMRVGEVDLADRVLDLMEAIYYEMRGLEYPDALIPGVKHKVDVARRLIDDTKALLLEVKGRREVLKALGQSS